MKKVLFFIESLSGGGAEKVLSDLVSNLDKTKYDVTVATVTNGGIYDEIIKSHCKYISFLDITKNKGFLNKIKYFLQIKGIYNLPIKKIYKKYIKDKYDIEIAFVEGFATKFIANSNNKDSNKLAWVHIDVNNNMYADSYYSNIDEQVSTYRIFDSILCVSNSVRDSVIKKFGIVENVQVQYNPVDSNAILALSKESVDEELREVFQFGTIGRLENQKGYCRLIDQLGRIKAEGYDFSLWIIGEGSQREILESKIKEYNLEDNVKLLGFHKNPYKYMSKCDAFLCSSYAEGFSTAATESLIIGKPIFTVECAGMKELFGHYNCGVIVDNSDENLYQMLKNTLDNTDMVNNFISDIENRKKDFDICLRIKEIEQIFDN